MKLAKFKLSAALIAVLLIASSAFAAPAKNAVRKYVVVVSEKTYADKAWKPVVEALVAKHNAKVVSHPGSVASAMSELAAHKPDFVCFVGKPGEMGRPTVLAIHRELRKLDKDPYTDAMWGIITGFDASDALRIAKHSKPLVIKSVMSSQGKGMVENFQNGFASDEGNPRNFWVRKDGKTTHKKVSPDPTEELAKMFSKFGPDYFETSGHATTNDWQIIYNQHKGQFRTKKNGQLYGKNSKGKEFIINSKNPKVYLPAGNCLIGRIPVDRNGKAQRNCMALAWMRTGGVYQMCGYTVVTWFGYSGWGTRGFMHENGHYNFAESFYFNNQSLMHQIATKYPRLLKLNCPGYSHRQFQGILGYMQKRMGLKTRDELGLLWDRDVQVFYGDPAWDARIVKENPTYTRRFEDLGNGTFKFIVETKTDGVWPGRPIAMLLPRRLENPKITEANGLKPVVTDNFVLLPMSGKFKAGKTFSFTFQGKDLKVNQADIDRFKKIAPAAALVPEKYRDALKTQLRLAGKNMEELIKAIENTPADRREEIAFLIANMPQRDLTTLSADYLNQTVKLACDTLAKTPWKDSIDRDMFLNNILPYCNLNEKRDPWRAFMMKKFLARAHKFKTSGEAAVWLNNNAFKELGVKYHPTKRPKPDQSSAESIKAGYASCTGLSVMLVNLCRSVGVPARIVGIPSWKKKITDANGNHGGNHNWVEIWDGKNWQHLGASEPGKLSRTWFTGKAGWASSTNPREWQFHIYAVRFSRKGSTMFFPLVWDLTIRYVPAVDVTKRYKKIAAELKKEKEAAKKAKAAKAKKATKK